jgi:molybdate transport system substrate-binding protein
MRSPFHFWIVLLAMSCVCNATADEARVAVAANFAGPAKQLQELFSRSTPHKLSISVGSTGKFYAQIRNGAPFDVLLSADDETPLRLEQEKLAVARTRFTYAVGKLVLWSALPDLIDAKGDVLKKASFKRLAIANPKLAPYGTAAQQVMERLNLWPALQPRLVLGENIAQTLQFIATGNAELGFVALSQVRDAGKPAAGSQWVVPQALYDPIRQDAVLLARGSANPAARALLDFLRTPQARDTIRAAGYDLP